jgi:hypothetical protein
MISRGRTLRTVDTSLARMLGSLVFRTVVIMEYRCVHLKPEPQARTKRCVDAESEQGSVGGPGGGGGGRRTRKRRPGTADRPMRSKKLSDGPTRGAINVRSYILQAGRAEKESAKIDATYWCDAGLTGFVVKHPPPPQYDIGNKTLLKYLIYLLRVPCNHVCSMDC